MTDFIPHIFIELNPLSVAVRILLAVLAGVLIGRERGRYGRAAGLRTHVLVSLGAAMSSLVGTYMVETSGSGDPSRIAAGVVSGVGFLCAGIILVRNNAKVMGLTTAAAMWTTATVGLAFGAGFYTAGLIGTVAVYLCLTLMTLFEIKQKQDHAFLIELDDATKVNSLIAAIHTEFSASHSYDVLPARSGAAGHVAVSVHIDGSGENVTERLQALDGVIFVLRQ